MGDVKYLCSNCSHFAVSFCYAVSTTANNQYTAADSQLAKNTEIKEVLQPIVRISNLAFRVGNRLISCPYIRSVHSQLGILASLTIRLEKNIHPYFSTFRANCRVIVSPSRLSP